MKWLVRDHRGMLVGSGTDPEISSDFSAVVGEANFLHLLQELEGKKVCFFFRLHWYKHNPFSILGVRACLVTKKD